MRVDVVVLQHGCHLIKGCVFLVKHRAWLWSPYLAQQPFASLAASVFIVLPVLVRLLQEQDANCKPKNNNKGAHNVGKKERVGFENGTDKYVGRQRGLCENTAK